MKFRDKVLCANLILLSICLGFAGYLMIYRNFTLAWQSQLEGGIASNNMVQSMVEYELLSRMNNSEGLPEQYLPDIGAKVAGSIHSDGMEFAIRYGEKLVYSTKEELGRVPEKLFQNLEVGGKNYQQKKVRESYYIYVTSCSKVNDRQLNIISRNDAGTAYTLMKQQTAYYRLLSIGMLAATAVVLYILCRYLTRPLEELNRVSEQMADGDYATKAAVNTSDEIGELALKFNRMSDAVAGHMKALEDMVHQREQFVADFTHEIKTPMTAIIGYADTMRSMELPRQDEIMALNYIFSEGQCLETMSKKLFQLIYLNQHEIDKKPLHIPDLVRETGQLLAPFLKEKKIGLDTDIKDAVIEADKELLVTALYNILDNAKKGSGENSIIKITGKEEGTERYRLTVTDYGTGMDKEDIAHICDEFYMADKSRSRSEGGAGLGMSLVFLIIKRHDAKLLVESEKGQGTSVHLLFPMKKEND